MQLFADRFAIDDDGRAIDLATSRRIELRTIEGMDGGDRAEQVRWSIRCDRWLGIQHRVIARLIDYGLAGPVGRFEAWDCGTTWEGSGDEADRLRAIASGFLGAIGLTTVPGAAVHARDGRALIVPGEGDGHEMATTAGRADSMSIADRGLSTVPRPAVAAFAEMFDSIGDRQSPMAALWGAAGSGKRMVVLELARAARLKGFVPVASQMLRTRYAPLWQGRNLFVIHDERTGPGPWPSFIQSTLRTPLPHALLLVGEREPAFVHGIGLGPIAPADLMSAVSPPALTPRLERTIARAAEASRGLPGRFARLLWPDWIDDRAAPRGRVTVRAAERAIAYGADEPIDTQPVVGDSGGVRPKPDTAVDPWPSPGELAALRQRVASAIAELARGRHAPAIRQLRQASSALARRDAWTDAAAAALAIARALLVRGRARDAMASLDDARQYAGRGGDDAALLDVAILSGEARIDLVRFYESETILAAAVATARHTGDESRIASASIALSRCLFWRGRFVDAASALDRIDGQLPL
ncbi:MAG TPA: hypothetical protein VGY57_06840, partial [Vicinamibacterales bacterium]|nr:hypothetical protein [Vicinamibacterales bacterium]